MGLTHKASPAKRNNMDESLAEQNQDRLIEDLGIEATEFIEVGDYVNAQSLVEQVKRLDVKVGEQLQNELDATRKQETEY